MPKTTRDLEEYLSYFRDDAPAPSERQRLALEHALDIRKFEIDTYWKRATYFWALIAASFVGFFTLKANEGGIAALLIGGLGLSFSIGWYLVNRGSSSWQRNWEMHVDLLEDAVMGPLYKTLMNRKVQAFEDLAGPYPYSPSRINTMLSLATVGTWLLLLVDQACQYVGGGSESIWQIAIAVGLIVFGIIALLVWGKSTSGDDRLLTFEARTRGYGTDPKAAKTTPPASASDHAN